MTAVATHRTSGELFDDQAADLAARLADANGAEALELRNQLVTLHLGTADALALRYRGRGHDVQDLIQVARVGLIEAARRYDPERGPFVAFAVPTIVGGIKRYFRDHAWFVRPPRRLQENSALVNATTERLSHELRRRPSTDELAERTGLSVDDVRECRGVVLSFDPISMHELAIGDPDARFEEVEASMTVGSACSRLSPEDRRLVYLRFYCQLSQQEVAALLGVSQMQISRWQRRILTTLKADIDDPDETDRLSDSAHLGRRAAG